MTCFPSKAKEDQTLIELLFISNTKPKAVNKRT